MRPLDPLRRAGVAAASALLLVGGAVAVAPVTAAAPPPGAQAPTVEPPQGGRLQPLTPARLLDTRQEGGAVRAGQPRRLTVAGRGGVPSSGVAAVVLNVTVTGGSERSDLQVFPVGQRPPRRTSNLNWKAGETVPVQVQTGLGTDGAVAFSVHSGTAHVVVDVFGWYGDGSRAGDAQGSGYTALSPSRILDTRQRGGPVQAGQPRTVRVTGHGGVPTGARAVMLNATMLGTPGDADLQVFPTGQRPEERTSNLNVSRGETRANAVLSPVGDDGSIGLSVSQDAAHVVLDVLGYYSPDSAGRFVSVSPSRVLDTRSSRAPVRAGAPRTPRVANAGGVPLNATAAVLNVTATAASDRLDLQVYPVGQRPERRTSTLNLHPGEAVPNLAVATLGTDGQIGLSPAQGSVHVVLDVLGYFTDATWSTCRNPRGGWTAEFPGDWRTGAGTAMAPCSLFDPQAFALPGQPQEIPLDLAVQLRREPVDTQRAREDRASRQLSERQATVDGRTAYRQEREQTQGTTVPSGTRYTTWLVDLGDDTLIATAYDVGEPSYRTKVDVLDAMMSRLALDGDGGSSAAPAFPDRPSASRSEASADARLTVADVRTGGHDGFDRVVFDLGGTGTPGWQVEYRDTVHEQGSGRPVELAGDADLRILIRGTVAPPSTDEPYYDGPDRVSPRGTSNAQEVYMGTWFEGTYDAAIGLKTAQPFRVFSLEDPNRLVVDVRTGPPPSAPQIAAVGADGRAVLLDGQTGEVRRVLLEGLRVDDPADLGLAVTPDRRDVFVVRPAGTGQDADIVRVSASGGQPQPVAQGQSPAVSPDGSTLAYVRFVDTEGPTPAPTLRLRTLATGQERELRADAQSFYGIWNLTWLEDGNRIAFTAGEIQQGAWVIDRTAGSLDEARRIGPSDSAATWTDVAALQGDRIAVVERCCEQPAPDPQRWRVIGVDATSGRVDGEVFGRDRTEASLVDGREDGPGLVVVQRGGPSGGPLLRWDGSGELRQLRDGVIVAAW